MKHFWGKIKIIYLKILYKEGEKSWFLQFLSIYRTSLPTLHTVSLYIGSGEQGSWKYGWLVQLPLVNNSSD